MVRSACRACGRALEFRYHSYKAVASWPTVWTRSRPSSWANQPSMPLHANIRGNDYYHSRRNADEPATQEKLTQMRLWGMQRAFRGVLEGGIGSTPPMNSSAIWSMPSGMSAKPPAGAAAEGCLPLSELRADRLSSRAQSRQESGAAPVRRQLGAGAPQCHRHRPHRGGQKLPLLSYRPSGVSARLQDPLFQLHQVLPADQALGSRWQLPQTDRPNRQNRCGYL